jgi:hypothetical protein
VDVGAAFADDQVVLRARVAGHTPEQPTISAGSSLHAIPVLSTNTIPAGATRSPRGPAAWESAPPRLAGRHQLFPQRVGYKIVDQPAKRLSTADTPSSS